MTDAMFRETTEAERGFAPVFAAKITPELVRLEAKRLDLDAKGNKRLIKGLVAGGAMFLLALAISLSAFSVVIGLILAVFGILGGLLGRDDAADSWGAEMTGLVMPAVCGHLGDVRYSHDGSAFDLEPVKRLKIVKRFDNAKLSHLVEGSHLGVPFQMVWASLTGSKRDSEGRSSEGVFSGLLFKIEVPEPAPTRIMISRDKGKMGSLFQSVSTASVKIDTGHPRFETAFDLFAAAHFDVDAFLPPRFLDILVDLGEAEGGGTDRMTAVFEGRNFYLALRGGRPFLGFHRLSRPAHRIVDDVHQVFEDVMLPHRIIDRLSGG